VDKFDGKVPNTLEDLMSLKGIGPKMAHMFMQLEYGVVEGVSANSHVHRIANRLRWVENPTKDPNETAKALEDWLPRENWEHINGLLTGFGQVMCKSINPRCWECPIEKLCLFKQKNLKPSSLVKKSPNVTERV